MKLETSKIRNGEMIGSTVWVCSYHQPDIDKKPLRNVAPVYCMVMSADNLKQTIYYSKAYFAPIGKNGNPTEKVIKAVDNTGYRSYCGNEIDVFDNEEECIESWNEQVSGTAEIMKAHAKAASEIWMKKHDNLLEKLA